MWRTLSTHFNGTGNVNFDQYFAIKSIHAIKHFVPKRYVTIPETLRVGTLSVRILGESNILGSKALNTFQRRDIITQICTKVNQDMQNPFVQSLFEKLERS